MLKVWIVIDLSLITNSNIMANSSSSFKRKKTECMPKHLIHIKISIDNRLDRFSNLLRMQLRFILNINQQNLILIHIQTTLITRWPDWRLMALSQVKDPKTSKARLLWWLGKAS